MEAVNSRVEEGKDIISELEDIAEKNQSKQQLEKKIRKWSGAQRSFGTT